MLKGYREWDLRRKAEAAKYRDLDLERLHRREQMPVNLTREARLELMLKYALKTPWASGEYRAQRLNKPQGGYSEVRHLLNNASGFLDALGGALGLPLMGLELTRDGELWFQFKPHRLDSCKRSIIVGLDPAYRPFSGWRMRSTEKLDPTTCNSAATMEFFEHQREASIIAAWEHVIHEQFFVHFLWSNEVHSFLYAEENTPGNDKAISLTNEWMDGLDCALVSIPLAKNLIVLHKPFSNDLTDPVC